MVWTNFDHLQKKELIPSAIKVLDSQSKRLIMRQYKGRDEFDYVQILHDI